MARTPETSSTETALRKLLADMTIDPTVGQSSEIQRAIKLARLLQSRGAELQTPQEKRQQSELERMMESQDDKAILTQMTDQAFRSNRARRSANQLTHILDVQGIPRFFTTYERALLKGFQSFGNYLPGVAVPRVKHKMREETANVILPAEAELLARHLEERRQNDVRMNVNYLGEALLGEDDAGRRLHSYLAALQLPQIECISVKISTIYSQISSISRKSSTEVLCDRMELLYRAAAKERFTRLDGEKVPKFVYLDMEEYRDLSITLETFMRTLSRPGLEQVTAGIALQAYLPDSFAAQKEINSWSKKRLASGGAPVTIRIVKGANMEMECVESSIAGWPLAPYAVKAETDANYKRMLHEGMRADNIKAVRLGVASHNLFDLSYALVLASDADCLDMIQFEMLEGMANHQRRALCELTNSMLLYAPATHKEDFVNAIGYLIRRLDENTGPENFLRHAFKLEVGSEQWRTLEQGFVDSCALVAELREQPKRTQDRNREPDKRAAIATSEFVNEPDTDFSLPQNYEWAQQIVESWQPRFGENACEIPVVVAGKEILADRSIRECWDPSRPGVVVGRYRQASMDDLDAALACAKEDPSGWRTMDESDRASVLAAVAHELRRGRADLMGAAMADAGKTLSESDPEVSEAIDFVDYYAATARDFRRLATVEATPKGVVAVVPPWNFPIAIPCGGISAALAAGNTVLLKPASHSVLVAYQLCLCFWRAGVSKEALQFVPCSGATGGAKLVASDAVDVVILTGGTDTALRMLAARPEMNLLAETGGKDATVVTSMSDREQAIKHILQSAFGHSGQKCSATSMLVLEAEVFDDPAFKQTLSDAIRSIKVGSAWSLETKMGPMITPPSGDLERALKELEIGESWAVMPNRLEGNPNLYSPALKWGVSPGSYTHMTEFFGPVLAVLRAENLDEAIELVNQTGYGLTSGLESLDEREHAIWRDGIRAGNLYINRITTGAIVQRQPFGGMGKSAFGPGIKAGGPNYVAQLMNFRDRDDVTQRTEVELPEELERLRVAIEQHSGDQVRPADKSRLLVAMSSYAANFADEFGREHDVTRLVGQDNIRRYLPVPGLRIRIHQDDTAFDICARVCAARVAGCGITVSWPAEAASPLIDLLDTWTQSWGGRIEFVEESDEELAAIVADGQTDRVRYAAPGRVPRRVVTAIGDTGVFIANAPVRAEGRVELLWYVMEQSISHDYHRYGNLGMRADEERRSIS